MLRMILLSELDSSKSYFPHWTNILVIPPVPALYNFNEQLFQIYCDFPAWKICLYFAKITVITDMITDPIFFGIREYICGLPVMDSVI